MSERAIGKDDFEQTACRVGAYLALSTATGPGELSGTFFCDDGVFDVWILNGRGAQWTAISTVHEGLLVCRSWRRAWSSRTIPTLCRRFIKDLRK